MPQFGRRALHRYAGSSRSTGPGARGEERLSGDLPGTCPWRGDRRKPWGRTAGLQRLTKNVFLFSGKKQDTWFIVDPKSGEKQTTLSTEAWDGLCPSSPLLYIGRTRKPVLLPVCPSSPRNGVLGSDLEPCSHPQSMSSPCMTPSHGSCAGTPPSRTTRHHSARSPTTTVSDCHTCGSHGSQVPQHPARSGTPGSAGTLGRCRHGRWVQAVPIAGENGCRASSPWPVAGLGGGRGGQSPAASTAASPPPSGSA